ncbi:DUF6278 family protein [Streptomyces stelliscabiei]
MNISFLGNWRKRRGSRPSGVAGVHPRRSEPTKAGLEGLGRTPRRMRTAARSGRLRQWWRLERFPRPRWKSPIDQLVPRRWRDRRGDGGLARQRRRASIWARSSYETVPRRPAGEIWPNGQPVVRLVSGREIDVVAAGQEWAASGAPELSQLYAEGRGELTVPHHAHAAAGPRQYG